MNTVAKGNQFEEKSREIIQKLVDNGLFGIKELLKIIPKAKYYSHLRKADIEFDLTIEFWPPGAERPMITYFIECKDYNKRIPVEQVQKFHSDVTQVAGINAKAVFISNSPFQKSAHTFAESTGMLVIEGESVDNFKIILHKRIEENTIPFVKETIDESSIDQGIKAIEKMIDQQLLNCLIQSKNNISFGIDKLSKDNISDIAEKEIDSIDTTILKRAHALNYDTITKHLADVYDVNITHFNPNKAKVLGFCDMEKNTIGLSKSIIKTNRELFLLGHEFGHLVLHQKLYINQQLLNAFSDSTPDLSTGKHRLENPRHWIEWQANYFAISLLVPRTSLMAKLWQAQMRRKVPKGNLYLDDQWQNQKLFINIIEYLSDYFGVSKTSIIYRLKELDLINDNSRTKRVGELISDYKSRYFV